MAVTRRTVDFLPGIFRTDTNKKFLGSTLDQLVSEPSLTRFDGFIGRQFAPTYNANDGYLVEPTTERQNYQLEPAVKIQNSSGAIENIVGYTDLLNQINYYGGVTSDPNRLFGNEYYSFDPQIDLDKFVNYSQYYWLVNGPDTINLSADSYYTSNVFTITSNISALLTSQTGSIGNPTITLLRGQTYTFVDGAAGNIWIQTETGVNGTQQYTPSLSSRSILGVTGNGTASITFNVPSKNQQDSLMLKPVVDYVDFATANSFTSLDGTTWTAGLTIDTSNIYPQDRFIIFLSTSTNAADWTDRNSQVIPVEQRRGIWQIEINHLGQLSLVYAGAVPDNHRIEIQSGSRRGQSYLVENSAFVQVPEFTAARDTLYYQSDSAPGLFGRLRLVDNIASSINVDTTIVGQVTPSFNGIALMNGMKIAFDNSVEPSSYRNKTYIVEGVGTSTRLIDFSRLITPEVANYNDTLEFDSYNFDTTGYDEAVTGSRVVDYITINRASLDQNAWSRGNRWVHVDVIERSAELSGSTPRLDLAQRALRPIIEFNPNMQLFDSGRVGKGAVSYLFDSTTRIQVNGQTVDFLDYQTQANGRSIADLDTRGLPLRSGDSVVFAADQNVTVRPNIYSVNYIDQAGSPTRDGTITGNISIAAGSTRLVGVSGVSVFASELYDGSHIYTSAGVFIGRVLRVINNFTAVIDTAPVTAIASQSGAQFNTPRVDIVFRESCQAWDSLVVVAGVKRGLTFYLKQIASQLTWRQGQNKTAQNQEPKFDIFDQNFLVSVGDTSLYPLNDFTGTSLFAYARSQSVADPVLGFPVAYSNNGNSIGDLLFVNHLENDTFDYVPDSATMSRVTKSINTGTLVRYTGYTQIDRVNLWSTVAENSKQYRHVSATFTGETNYFEIGVAPAATTTQQPNVKVYINGRFLPGLVAGAPTTALTTTIVNSQAAGFAAAVNEYYLVYIGRYADQATLDYWVSSAIANGISQVEYSIRYSQEAVQVRDAVRVKFGPNTPKPSRSGYEIQLIADAIHDIYVTFLGRYAEQSGLDYWVESALTWGIGPVESGIRTSAEAVAYQGRFRNYVYEVVNGFKTIRINQLLLTQGDRIDIRVYSSEVGDVGYYEIPVNLEFNALNQPVLELTLGQLRNHLNEKLENTINPTLGTRSSAGTILQHSAPLSLASLFLSSNQVNFINSIELARRDYTRFKNKFLELAVTLDLDHANIPASVDVIINNINAVKNSTFAWNYSDMVPSGANFRSLTYPIANTAIVTGQVYSLSGGFDINTVGNQAVLVYLDNQQLTLGQDYLFTADKLGISLTSAVPTLSDVQLVIKEYFDTDGCFVPETPTKLGLYPKFVPTMYTDSTYRTPITVVQGHDGSLTPAFGDFRDSLLIELERRIYNNIKTSYSWINFDINKETPGKFRTTAYSRDEFRRVLDTEFLKWAGTNRLNFVSNTTFLGNDDFTWNYNQTPDRSGQSVPGFWRGIYRYYYDTDRPHTHPWEMLGYTIKPTWWDTHYSWTDPTKRTALIQAVTVGNRAQPSNPQLNPVYARDGFADLCPVDLAGNLLSPLKVMIGAYNSNRVSMNWSVGDQGPVESAWRRSSDYAFSLQRTLALLKPAVYFGTMYDASRYRRIQQGDVVQYVNVLDRSRHGPDAVVINGEMVNGVKTRAAGYMNWVHGYLTNMGFSAAEIIRARLDSLSVNLCYRMAGFSDKKLVSAIAEQTSPGSVNESILIPDENYDVYLNSSTPIARAVYSAVIIERTASGYSINGYDTRYPYFTIVPSQTTGNSYTIDVLAQSSIVFTDYRLEKIRIPYGFEFTENQQVVDFLIGYQRYLQSQGFVFDEYDQDLAVVRDWALSSKEFLTWATQNWPANNVIVLSPVIDRIKLISDTAVVGHISNQTGTSQLIGVNFNVIKNNEFGIIREPATTSIYTLSGQTIGYAELNLIQYEHVLVFDNTTVFNDIIYKPELGNRQFRIRLVGSRTAEWNGQLTPLGFVYNSGAVAQWRSGQDYNRGDIVRYKDRNYTAIENIPAAATFDFAKWSVTDTVPQAGLEPNFAASAGKFENFYDVINTPLDEDQFKFGFGLIGFRNRTYLENLGMNPTAQVKFYQGYIKTKGTAESVNALGRSQFDYASNLEITEEWAARTGEFGAIDANPEIHMIVPEANTLADPLVFELLADGETVSNSIARAVYPGDLLYKTLDYDSTLFRNRNDIRPATWTIELFGDGVMCGRDVKYTPTSFDFLACANGDRATGRVTYPPDYLLYESLGNDFDLAITTRSLERTGTADLLSGAPGGTGPWPDDIEAKIVVINHGHGDARSNTPIADYRTNLRTLRRRLRPEQIVVWVTPTPIDTNNIAAQWEYLGGNTNIAGYAQAMREVAAEFSDVVADAYNIPDWLVYLQNPYAITASASSLASAGTMTFTVYGENQTETVYYAVENAGAIAPITSDGIHPNQAGYAAYAEVIATAIRQAIRNNLRSLTRDYQDDLQTTGYVLTDEVDALVFDINNYQEIGSEVLDSLYTGYRLWVARDFDGDWQVYRAFLQNVSITRVRADLDNKVVFEATGNLALRAGTVFAINDVNSDFNGFYQAFSVEANEVTVIVSTEKYELLALFGVNIMDGELYDFQPSRFANITARDQAQLNSHWVGDDLVYVDDSGDDIGSWAVYRRNAIYSVGSNIATIGSGATVEFTVNSAVRAETVYYSLANVGAVSYTVGPMWTRVRGPDAIVDYTSANNIYLYSKKQREILARLDILDPIQGRLLGSAQQNLDYATSFDPAQYSSGSSDILSIANDFHWTAEHVGEYWWITSRAGFVNYHIGDLAYRVNNWSTLFPGSSVEVYQWLESDVLPSQYQAAGYVGTPLYSDDTAYTTYSTIDPATNTVRVRYYYWVRGSGVIPANKTMSTGSVESYIAEPRQQEQPYLAIVNDQSLALFNVGRYISGTDTVLYLSYQPRPTENLIHSSYELIQPRGPSSQLPARIEDKLIDSLCGTDINQRNVPDPALSEIERLGLSARPRQTLIVDQTLAVENVIKYINFILMNTAVSSRLLDVLGSETDNFYAREPEPTVTSYQYRVNSYSANSISNLNSIIQPLVDGDIILIESDERAGNYWTLRQYHAATNSYQLLKRQGFDVRKNWYFQDWYAPGYSSATPANYIVDQYRDIQTLDIQANDIVLVLNRSIQQLAAGSQQVLGNFELYLFETATTKRLIGLGNGTIQLNNNLFNPVGFDTEAFDSDAFDHRYSIELRYIMQGLKQEVFVNDLQDNYDAILYYLVDYILSEQKYIDWMFKTSFITVFHEVKGLLQLPAYIRDRQTLYENYINEVKPYRTKIREYVISYQETESTAVGITDFDLPGYYEKSLARYRSPNGEYPAIDSAKFNSGVYRDWWENYGYELGSVEIARAGYGYRESTQTQTPTLAVVRADTSFGADAQVSLTMNTENQSIVKARVVDAGTNYTLTPQLQVLGSGGTDIVDQQRHEYLVSSVGLGDTSGRPWQLFNTRANVAVFTSAARSYTMHRIRRVDGQVVFTRQYDVYGSSSNSTLLAQDLEATTSEYVVVVHTYDDPQVNRTSTDLVNAMYRCGASAEIFGSVNFRYGSAYILVGIPGSGTGNGIEVYSGASNSATNAYASLKFRIQHSQLFPIEATPKVLDISGANVAYTDGQYLTRLSSDMVLRSALLTPRLVNNRIRKVRTVVRFDRVSYTSNVTDYIPAGFDNQLYSSTPVDPYAYVYGFSQTYTQGSFISYQGRAYEVLVDFVAGPVLDFANVRLVGSREPVTSSRYLDGYFDNANDRIMGYYNPSADMEPKILSRLVSGLDSTRTYTVTKTDDYNDTILSGDTFSNPSGISPGNITVSGGNFVNAIFSRSPEELLPGQVFETLFIRVTVNSSIASTDITGVPYLANISTTDFSLFKPITGNIEYHNSGSSFSTTLAAPLNLLDANITVVNGSVLPATVVGIEPAVIYVNGESISYRVRNGNVLSQIRRGYNGTGTPQVHPAGSRVEDISLTSLSASIKA